MSESEFVDYVYSSFLCKVIGFIFNAKQQQQQQKSFMLGHTEFRFQIQIQIQIFGT